MSLAYDPRLEMIRRMAIRARLSDAPILDASDATLGGTSATGGPTNQPPGVYGGKDTATTPAPMGPPAQASTGNPVRDRLSRAGLTAQNIQDLRGMHESAKAAAGMSDAKLREARASGDLQAISAAEANHRQNLTYLNHIASQVTPTGMDYTPEQDAARQADLQRQFAWNVGNIKGQNSANAIDAKNNLAAHDPAATARAFFSRPLVGDGVSGVQGDGADTARQLEAVRQNALLARVSAANRTRDEYAGTSPRFSAPDAASLSEHARRIAARDQQLQELMPAIAARRAGIDANKTIASNELGNAVRESDIGAARSKIMQAEAQRALIDANQKTAVASTGTDAETEAMKRAKLDSIRSSELVSRAKGAQETASAAINNNPAVKSSIDKIIGGFSLIGTNGVLDSTDPAGVAALRGMTEGINVFDSLPDDVKDAAAQELSAQFAAKGVDIQPDVIKTNPISTILNNIGRFAKSVPVWTGTGYMYPVLSEGNVDTTDAARQLKNAFYQKIQLRAARSARNNTK